MLNGALPGFSELAYAGKRKQARREKFLTGRIQAGRSLIGLERMLRLYFLHQWYGLADEALEEAIYNS